MDVLSNGNEQKLCASIELKQVDDNSLQKTSDQANEPQKSEKIGGRTFTRHFVAIFGLFSVALANMSRQTFNQAVTNMTKSTPSGNQTLPQGEGSCPRLDNTNLTELTYETKSPATDFDKFDWDMSDIATLQMSFTLGYIPLMVTAGRLSEIYGAYWVVLFCMAGSSVCCLLAPILAQTHIYLLAASRFVMGLVQGGVSPSLYSLCAVWTHPDEAKIYVPMMRVAVMIGFLLGTLIGGSFQWKTSFYVSGGVSFCFSIFWALIVTSDPASNRLVNEAELSYIKGGRAGEIRKPSTAGVNETKHKSAPWLKILTNKTVLGFMFTKFTIKLSTESQTQLVPLYLKKVLHLQSQTNTLLNSINYGMQAIFTGLIALSAKKFTTNRFFRVSTTQSRRLFQGICNFGMAAAWLLLAFCNCSVTWVIIAIIQLSVASMFTSGGEVVLPLDISTEYPASIMAIANLAANFSNILLPLMTTKIIGESVGSEARWSLLWIAVASIIALGGIVFCTVVEAKSQDFTGRSAIGAFFERCWNCLVNKAQIKPSPPARGKIGSRKGVYMVNAQRV